MTTVQLCAIDGCERNRYGKRTVCNTHAMRKHRYGDVHADRTPKAREMYINSAGYRKVLRRDHVLADGGGYVYEHRLVLHTAIGGGAHPCHWCSIPVTWMENLEVDHVDSDRLNNDPSNLVPSCHGCNTRRALQRRWSRADSRT